MTLFLTFGNSTSSASLNIKAKCSGFPLHFETEGTYDRFLIFVLIMKNVNNVYKYVYCILNMMCNGVG